MWVKQGSVSLYGAILRASTAVYQIYAPSTHSLPSIESLSANAEFELESLDDGLGELPHICVKHLWDPWNVVPTNTSTFYVLGHTFDHDPKTPGRWKELSLSPWKGDSDGLFWDSEHKEKSEIKAIKGQYKDKSLDEVLRMAEGVRAPLLSGSGEPPKPKVMAQVLGFKFRHYQVR